MSKTASLSDDESGTGNETPSASYVSVRGIPPFDWPIKITVGGNLKRLALRAARKRLDGRRLTEDEIDAMAQRLIEDTKDADE